MKPRGKNHSIKIYFSRQSGLMHSGMRPAAALIVLCCWRVAVVHPALHWIAHAVVARVPDAAARGKVHVGLVLSGVLQKTKKVCCEYKSGTQQVGRTLNALGDRRPPTLASSSFFCAAARFAGVLGIRLFALFAPPAKGATSGCCFSS